MADSLLDKHPGARRYVAHLHSYGATRAQICAKLAEKYPMRAPTTRSMTKWLNDDPELVKMIRELEEIKSDMAPGDSALAELPEPVDRGEVAEDLFGVMEQFPAFNALSVRCSNDPDFPDDVWLKVLCEDHADDAAFEAACAAGAGDYDPMTAAVEAHFAKHHEHHRYADA